MNPFMSDASNEKTPLGIAIGLGRAAAGGVLFAGSGIGGKLYGGLNAVGGVAEAARDADLLREPLNIWPKSGPGLMDEPAPLVITSLVDAVLLGLVTTFSASSKSARGAAAVLGVLRVVDLVRFWPKGAS